MSPLVSIVIPVFNQNENYLRDCMASALAQSYKNIEIIISDNHSTNSAAQVISKYQDSRIKVFRPIIFLSMNDNFAFAASCATVSSKYISFLSSDDLLAPNAIEQLVAFAEKNPSATFIAGNIIQSIEPPASFEQQENRIRASKNKLGLYTFKEAIHMFCPWKASSTWMAGDLIKHDAYRTTGGFSNCDYYVSGDLWLTKELLVRNGYFACIEQTTAFFRQRLEGTLPADGDRSLDTDLDMLRYCTEMLRMVKNKNVGIQKIFSIHYIHIRKLCRLVLLTLLSRKFGYPFNQKYLNQLQKYVICHSTHLEKSPLKWSLTVQGVPLFISAHMARWIVKIRGAINGFFHIHH